MKKNNNADREDFVKSQRMVDQLTQETLSWWGKSFVFMKKTKIKTWKAILIIAFLAGMATALILSVSFNIQSNSMAANGATLTLDPNTVDGAVDVSRDENFSLDVVMDTQNNDVVATKVMVDFDKNVFSLENYDTSNSIFAAGNGCVYNNKPCEIIGDDRANGHITIALAKPTPGVNTDSGVIATLTFKALESVPQNSTLITINFTQADDYGDSDVIKDDGNGTDILSGVVPVSITVNGPACTTIAYTDWGTCQPGGVQTREVDEDNSLPAGCNTGAVNPSTLSQSCPYVAPTCTDFTYNAWSACQPDNTRFQSVATSSPANCVGGNPVIKQDCVYGGGPEICASFVYSFWSACQPDNTQFRTVETSTPANCTEGNPNLEQACNYSAPTCASFNYSDWGSCHSDNTQSRTVTSTSPAGCSGGTPTLVQSCGNSDSSDSHHSSNKKSSNSAPKFVNTPTFLTKSRGTKVWWNATDKDGIKYFMYSFLAPYKKAVGNSFIIPRTAPRGLHVLWVKAYDKKGNSSRKTIMIMVR